MSRHRSVAVLLSAVAVGLSFHPAVAGSRLFVVVALSGALPLLGSAVPDRWRVHRPLWIVLGWPVAAALLLWPGRFPVSVWDVARTASKGFGPLLDWVPPAPEQPELLVLPSLLVWLVASAGMLLAARDGAGLLLVVPGWAVWAVVVVLSAPDTRSHVATGAVLLAATVVAAPPSGAVVSTVVAGLVVAAGGVGLGLGYDGGDARDVRAALPPDNLDVHEDLLGRYDRWRANPSTTLFDVAGTGAAPTAPGLDEPHWRLTDLSELDGDRWISPAAFHRLGEVRPTSGRTVTVTGLDTAFLPGDGRPVTPTGGAELWVDAAGGTTVRRDRGQPVTYVAPPGPAAPRSSADDDALDQVPSGCGGVADDVAPAFGTAGLVPGPGSARQLATYLGPVATTVAGGPAETEAPYGCAAVARAVRDRHATEVQRVVAYVLAARRAGVPARIVVGFRDTGRSGPVTGADARVWPEVRPHGQGWLAVPIPQTRATDAPVPPVPPPSGGPPPPPPPEKDDASAGFQVDRHWLLLLAAALALIAVCLLGGLGLVRLTDRIAVGAARRNGSPAERVVAAWTDLVARLGRADPRIPAHATATEITVAVTDRYGLEAGAQLTPLARDAGAVRYGHRELTETAATDAWATRDHLVGLFHRKNTRRARQQDRDRQKDED